MNIAVFIKKTTLHKGYGGIETFNKTLCEGLVKKGDKVTVFAPFLDLKSTASPVTENGVTYYFVNCEYKALFAGINPNSWQNKSVTTFRQVHALAKFDTVLSQSSAGIGIILHKIEFGLPIVSISHGSILGEFKTFLLNHHTLWDSPRIFLNGIYTVRQLFGRQRKFILNSSIVVAVSSAVKNQIIQETGISPNMVEVIHNGTDPIEATDDMSAVTSLLYVGQLTKDKGIELFSDMANDQRFKNYTLDVVGDGPDSHLLKNSSGGLTFNLLGKLAYEKTLAEFQKHSTGVFLFPTKRYEGFPMVLVEAMMAGMVVVTYAIGGTVDAVENALTGMLIEPFDSDRFKAQVLELLSNRDKLISMSRNARKKALTEFTLDTMLAKYQKLFERQLAK